MDAQQNSPCSSLSTRSIKIKFASRFLRALKNINKQSSKTYPNSSSSLKEITRRYKRVRMAADASMASAVGPKKAWSRATLMKLQTKSHVVKHGFWSRRSKRSVKRKGVDHVDEPEVGRTDELRRLVPGGGAMDLCSLLDETAHYIKCLTTQVHVMRSIASCSSTS